MDLGNRKTVYGVRDKINSEGTLAKGTLGNDVSPIPKEAPKEAPVEAPPPRPSPATGHLKPK